MPPSNVIVITHTAISAAAFKLTHQDLWLGDCNIHIATNNATYGDKNTQPALATTNDVLSFEDININDLFFANAVGVANTTIQIVGVLMSEARKKELEITGV